MLKQGLIKDTVNKSNFSEQCYFTFGNDPSRLQSSKNFKFTQNIIGTIQILRNQNSGWVRPNAYVCLHGGWVGLVKCLRNQKNH